MTELDSTQPHRWPARALCEADREREDRADCVCRRYDGQPGVYLLDPEGHARSWRRSA